MNSRLQFTYQCGTCCIFYCAKAQSLSIPVNSFKLGGLVDHLRGHQDHVVIFFVTFNLTHMKFVGSGSLLCRVIDPRPVYYLEHWSLLLQPGYRVSYTTCTTYTKMSSLSRIWLSDSLRVNTLWNLWLYTSVTTICETKRQQQLHEVSEYRWVLVILSINKIVLWFPHKFFPALQVG